MFGPLIVFILMTGKELIVFFHKNLLKKFAKIFKLTEVKFLLKLWGKEGRREWVHRSKREGAK